MARSKMSVYVKPAVQQAAEAAKTAKKETVALPDIILAEPQIRQSLPTKRGKGAKTEQNIILIDETAPMKSAETADIRPKRPLGPKPSDELVPDSTAQTQMTLQGEESDWQAPVADNENEADGAAGAPRAESGMEQAKSMDADAPQAVAAAEASAAVSAQFQPTMASSSLEPLRVLEAALFMSSASMQAADLGKLVGIGAVGHVSKLLDTLSKQYDASGSSLEVVEENPGKWTMRIRASFAPSVRRFAGEAEIPKHALRTLAYISRHEGITKRDLFRRLGGSIYEDVADLADKGFLQSKPQGRTQSLTTTTKFKQYFQG